MMKLYTSPISPFGRKVRIAALVTKQALDLVNVDVYDPTSMIRQINPLTKVPALIVSPDLTLCDSSVICRYLDQNSRGDFIFSKSELDKWRQTQLETIADGISDAAVLIRMETLRELSKQDAKWIRRQSEKVLQGLSYLEDHVQNFKPEPTAIAEISLACTIAYLEYRFSDFGFFNDTPKIKTWASQINLHPWMKETAPPPLAAK